MEPPDIPCYHFHRLVYHLHLPLLVVVQALCPCPLQEAQSVMAVSPLQGTAGEMLTLYGIVWQMVAWLWQIDYYGNVWWWVYACGGTIRNCCSTPSLSYRASSVTSTPRQSTTVHTKTVDIGGDLPGSTTSTPRTGLP